MSEKMKHTPGHWFYEGVGGLVGGPDNIRIADCNGFERIDTERMGNCHLIASAPELLSTLKFILADENTELCGDTFEIIQAAIAKAEGASR